MEVENAKKAWSDLEILGGRVDDEKESRSWFLFLACLGYVVYGTETLNGRLDSAGRLPCA